MKNQLKSQRGAIGVILLILGVVVIGAATVYVVNYAKAHPETTEKVAPAQTAEQGSKAIQDAKNLQNRTEVTEP